MVKLDFLKGGLYLALAQMVVIGTGYLIHLWVARTLGPYPYGLYGVILGVMGTVNLILTYGVSQALSKYTAERKDSFGSLFRKTLKIQLGLAFLVTSIYFLLASVFSTFLSDPNIAPLVKFTAIGLPFYSIYALTIGGLNGLHLFKKQAILSTSYSLVKFVTAVALTKPFGLFGALSGFIAAPLFGLIFGMLYLLGRVKTATVKTSVANIDLLRFSFSFSLLFIFLHLFMNTDLFFVKALVKDVDGAGFYTAATTIARIPYFVVAALGFTLLPTVSSLTKKGAHEELKMVVSTATRIVLLILVAGLALGLPESSKIITILYSSLYSTAVVPFSVLLVALSVLAIFLLVANVVAGMGKPHLPMAVSFLAIVISGALNLFLIPKYGLVGAATATLLAAIVATLIITFYLFRKVPHPNPKMLLRILLSGVIVLFLNIFLKVDLVLFIPKMFLLATLYITLLLALGEIKKEELFWLKTILKPKNSKRKTD